ncbi:MAG: NTP transferase domain-containing protein [Vicinamibacteria bacterium]|nr:NTP transferase domain-containing protein [Vicinamibacteria bacterium]
MRVRKALITAAGRGARAYPASDTVQRAMLPLVDRDGLAKPVLQIIAEEAIESGIEELCVVCAPGDEPRYREQIEASQQTLRTEYRDTEWARRQAECLGDLLRRLHFAVQEEPLGYGHAVLCARAFAGDEAVLLLLGDHLYVSHDPACRCAAQVVRLAEGDSCAVSAVQATREHLVGRYGTLTGARIAGRPGVYQIERIREKPSLSQAELELQTPGLRVGHYLCFFGMHVLTPPVFEILADAARESPSSGGELQLTPALNELARRERYLALEVTGRRYDIGARFGALQAQVALALAGVERESVLTTIVETIAEARGMRDPSRGETA